MKYLIKILNFWAGIKPKENRYKSIETFRIK